MSISIFAALMFFAFNAYAGYYDYSFENVPGNQDLSTGSDSNTDYFLQMMLWINDTDTITAKIERKDGQYMTDGKIYLQANSQQHNPLSHIDCDDDNTSVNDYSKTLTSLQSLDDIPVTWTNDLLLIYARYEDGEQFAWTGPIIIKRKVSNAYGSLQVGLHSSNAVSKGASWRFETPGSESGWSPWYGTGVEVSGLDVGIKTVQFRAIDGYITPSSKNVEIKQGQRTTTEAIYLAKHQSILGITLPSQATDAGAGWRTTIEGVGDSVYYPGNSTKENFKVGPATISFKPIEGWYTPDPQTIEIRADAPTIVTGIYCKIRPYAPDGVEASQGDFVGKVEFKWNPVSCEDRYEVYRSTVSEPTPEDRIAVDYAGTVYVDETGEAGREYYYWVRAVNERGYGDYSEAVIGYSNLDKPKNVVASDGIYTGKVRVVWDPVQGATSYVVYRNTDTSYMSVGEPIATDIEGTLFDDIDGTPGKKYYYWVKAENAIMTSDFSEFDSGFAKMGTPEFLDASDSTFTDKVEICNSPVRGAVAYEVEYALDSQKRKKSRTVRTKTTECYQHTTATPCKIYNYRVRAYNQYGAGDWTNYEPGSRAMPAPVIHASKRANPDKITISWLSVDGADLYYIFKNESNNFAGAIQVGQAIGNSYDYPTNETRELYFWVQAVNSFCTPVSEPAVGYISDGCEFSVSETDIVVDAETGLGTIDVVVESQSTCTWHAEISSDVDWIQIISGETGTNNGSVEFKADENRSLDSRSAIITVAGKGILVEQEGLNPTSLNVTSTDGGKLLINGIERELPFIQDVAIGDNITFEAIPDENWRFANFSGSVMDTTNPLTIEISESTNIVANFSQDQFCMNVSVVGSGQIYMNGKETLQECFAQGSAVNLMAVNDDDSIFFFTNWSGDVQDSNSATTQVLMDSDKEITALFNGWAVDIHAEGVNLNGYYKSNVTIGVGSELFFRNAPPMPPRYSSYMVVKQDNKDGVTYIQLDDQEVYQFVLSIDPHGNMGPPLEPQSTVVSWDPESFANEGTYQLIDGNDMDNSTIMIDDMRQTTEYTVTGLSSNQIFSIIWTAPPKPEPCTDCSEPVTMSLLCESGDFGGAYKVNATIGLDRLGKKTSSPPSPPVFSTAMSIMSANGKYLAVDIEEMDRDQKVYEWILVITPAGNALPIAQENTVDLSWELSEGDFSGKTFQLIKQKIENGAFVDDGEVVDMSQVNTVEVTGDDSKQYFKIVCEIDKDDDDDEKSKYKLELIEGWNLISLPLLPDNNIANYVIPSASVIYQYKGGGYEEVLKNDALETFVGYWVLVDSEVVLDIEGSIMKSNSQELSVGWHLLGCIDKKTFPETNVMNSIEVMYEYVDGSYEIVTECRPGFGFWINMLEKSTLILE